MDVIFQIETFESFQKITEDLLRNLHLSGNVTHTEVDSNVIDSAKDYIRKLITKSNFDLENVSEQLLNGNWEKDKVKHFISTLKKNKTLVFHSIIIHHNSSYTDTMINFDWSLKYVLGTSESKSLKYPSLQVILNSVNSNGDTKQRLFEMNKESLEKLIAMMEDYQKTIDNP